MTMGRKLGLGFALLLILFVVPGALHSCAWTNG